MLIGALEHAPRFDFRWARASNLAFLALMHAEEKTGLRAFVLDNLRTGRVNTWETR
jgi:hypothetical protein